jgi:hypothetical protein
MSARPRTPAAVLAAAQASFVSQQSTIAELQARPASSETLTDSIAFMRTDPSHVRRVDKVVGTKFSAQLTSDATQVGFYDIGHKALVRNLKLTGKIDGSRLISIERLPESGLGLLPQPDSLVLRHGTLAQGHNRLG